MRQTKKRSYSRTFRKKQKRNQKSKRRVFSKKGGNTLSFKKMIKGGMDNLITTPGGYGITLPTNTPNKPPLFGNSNFYERERRERDKRDWQKM